MKKIMEKYICYTLDLEKDFGGRISTCDSFGKMEDFAALIKKNRIRLTTFSAAHFFKDNPKIIDGLLDMGSEIELHSYSHPQNNDNEEWEILTSKKEYRKKFGFDAKGYRAPSGIISKKGLALLSKEGFLYDSSIYPTAVPGRYNNLGMPTSPFIHKGHGLIELPFSVIPKIHLPLAMGYLQPLGGAISHGAISLFGLPQIIVFDFHLWNLYPPKRINDLSFSKKMLLASGIHKGLGLFESLIERFDQEGYRPIHMGTLLKMAQKEKKRSTLVEA